MKQGVFKYIFVLGFIILLIITYVVFYSKDTSSQKIEDKVSTKSNLITNLRLGIAELYTLNPILTNNKNVKEISRLIFDSLVTVKNDYGLEFVLANGIAKENNLTYIITLRDDVKWQDGSDFTSQDVIFTVVDVIKHHDYCSYSPNLQYVDEISAIDEHTVKIVLSQEVEFFEYGLTMPILSSNYFSGEDVATSGKNNQPMGTGMFKYSSNENGLLVLVPNENYWNSNKKPLLTEIDINLYDTIGNMYAAFKSGYIDIMEVDSKNIQTYIGSLGYTKVDIPNRDVVFLSFNTSFDVLSDNRTRKAIALYIDRANLMANIGGGYLQTNFLIPSNSWIYNTKLDTVYLDNQGDRLLEEAGWRYQNNRWEQNGKILTFSITVDASSEDKLSAANTIAQQLSNHGISVNVQAVNRESFSAAFNTKNYQTIIAGIHTGFSPKVTALFGNDNLSNYNSENLNNIINDIKITTNYDKQIENYDKLYDEYLNSFPYIFLYRSTSSVVYNQTLCGKISPNSYSMFYNVEKWYRQ